MEQVKRVTRRPKNRSFRYGIAAIALCGGLAGGPVQSVAWADSLDSGSASNSASDTTSESKPASTTDAGRSDDVRSDRSTTRREAKEDNGPSASSDTDASDPVKPDKAPVRGAESDPEPETPDIEESPTKDVGRDEPGPVQPDDAVTDEHADTEHVDTEHVDTEHVDAEPDFGPQQGGTPEAETVRGTNTSERVAQKHGHAVGVEAGGTVATLTRPSAVITVEVPRAQRELAQPAVAVQAADAAPVRAAVTSPTTVEAPPSVVRPLSPLAELLELPGRLVNAVLQAFDITASANSPESPISWGPINDLVFGAFRELERLLGLHRAPAPQPVVPTLTYTGSTTRPTPTVTHFLNASTAGYVLGSTPGGLVPFTVNGFQMSSTNIGTGMVGDVWVTPERQVIIAYQGTTGGTHLVFNPLIAVSQVLADLQMVFTPTTPPGFHDAVDFAEEVKAEAALQGISSDDIFVTGHSLGGWQAQFVAQQTGLAGIGFEAPGMNSTVPGNGADSMFVNVGTYGSLAPYLSTDLTGLQPFMLPYVPGGGSKPHYGSIVMVGDPAAMTPLYNASQLWGTGLIGSLIFMVDALGNFGQYHMPGVQAYHLDVALDPGVTPWLGRAQGPILTGYGALTIPELMKSASEDGILFRP